MFVTIPLASALSSGKAGRDAYGVGEASVGGVRRQHQLGFPELLRRPQALIPHRQLPGE